MTWCFHEQIPFVLSSILPLPGTDPLLSLCQMIAVLSLSSITLSNCAITVALFVCPVVTVYPAQFPAWINALHALHSCDFTRCVRQTAKVRVREAPSDASGGAVAAADQRPAKRRLGEVEPGVFTIQGIVGHGHELMDDGLLGASLSASVSVCTPASDCTPASVKAPHCTRLTILCVYQCISLYC